MNEGFKLVKGEILKFGRLKFKVRETSNDLKPQDHKLCDKDFNFNIQMKK
jgi:hypothetical protein